MANLNSELSPRRLSSSASCDDNEACMSDEDEIRAQPGQAAVAEGPQQAVSSSLDEPIEAIVYDVYPAITAPRAAASGYDSAYPYGPPASFPPANCDPPAPI